MGMCISSKQKYLKQAQMIFKEGWTISSSLKISIKQEGIQASKTLKQGKNISS